tara:strand:+ start:482 stop:664 length:183 start_codon:yes stop_codon:yes gene_type:complete
MGKIAFIALLIPLVGCHSLKISAQAEMSVGGLFAEVIDVPLNTGFDLEYNNYDNIDRGSL